MKTNRRDFLKASAAVALAPSLLLSKRAFAATPGFGATRHVVVLYANGGFRSHCTFNAVGTNPSVNPFGAQLDRPGRLWKLGTAVGDQALSYTGAAGAVPVPSFATISPDVTVLGTVDHKPGGPVEIDHVMGMMRFATGDPYGTTGLLSLVGKDHPSFADGFSLTAFPPVEIVPLQFGIGSGSYAGTRPLTVAQAGEPLGSEIPIGKGWKVDARAAAAARFRDSRSRAYRSRLNSFIIARRNMALFADLLREPKLDVLGAPAAVSDGFSNSQLLEILGTDMWGANVALGLRFLVQGAPLTVIASDPFGAYDLHADEQTQYGPLAADLVRQLAGLHYLLHQIDHPAGGKYWDRTVVVVVSEFSRNNAELNGFNSGFGSDHVTEAANGPARNMAVPIMGGPIAASKGKLIGATDANLDAVGQVYDSRRILASLVDGLGINQNYFGVDPIQELYQ